MKETIRVSHTSRRNDRKKRRLIRLIFGLGAVVIFLFCLSFVLRIDSFAVRDVSVFGTALLDHEAIENEIKNKISGHYLWFLAPKNNSLIIPRGAIKDYLQSIPEIASFSLSLDGLSAIHIEISERKPAYIWCKKISDTQNTCAFADKDGFAFHKAPDIRGSIYTKLIGHDDLWSADGAYYAKEYMPIISDLEKFLNTKTRVFEINHNGYTDYDFILRDIPKIMIDAKKPSDKTISRLSVFFDNPPVPIEELEYIDARFGNKLFYKTKSGAIGR